MISTKPITFHGASYSNVKRLYQQAFPREERIPFPFLFLRSKAKWIEFLAFYDDEQFCGMACLSNSTNLTNIMYLAVAPSLRSKGYGSQFIRLIQQQHPNQTLVLEIEALDEQSPNYDQQLRRKNFYLRNGFMETGYGVELFHVKYEILKSKSDFQPMQWQQLTDRFTFKFVNYHPYPLPHE